MFIFLMQLIPTPIWPDLDTPTPYMTITPAPTSTVFASPTGFVTNTPFPTEVVTVEVPDDALYNNLSTSEAELTGLSNTVSTTDNQIFWNGNPILPDEDGASIFGYLKWLVSTGSESLFGPFAPIALHIGILLSLAFLSLVVYFSKMIATALFRGVSWVINSILKFIPFIG